MLLQPVTSRAMNDERGTHRLQRERLAGTG